MAQVYLYADPHFDHTNMAIKRGFETTEEHDEHVIKQWNNTVNKNDKIYLLGDITMEKKNYAILKRLKGQITVVGGNHDMPGHTEEMLKYISAFAGAIIYKGFFLTHIPIHPTEFRIAKYKGNIHGHVHENVLDDERYICVCAEVIDYKPVLFKDIDQRFITSSSHLVTGP